MNELINLFGIREPYKGELAYFAQNPTVAGMATEDNKIILNPYSKLSSEELNSVAQNEALRLFMRTNNIVPEFSLTKEQKDFFKGTEYAKNEEEAKKSIVARILTGDPSVQTASKEQLDFAEMLKKMIPSIEYVNPMESSFRLMELNWSLLPWQLEVWQDSHRFKVIAAGRRCGKSNLAIKMLLAKALEAPEGSAVVYVAPTLGQARQIAWDALLDQGRPVIKQAHVNNMDITLVTGRKIHIRSAENPDALRGLKLYFCVIDEAAFVKEDVFTKILRPALADLKGDAVLISTPDGRNWFYDAFKTGESDSKDWKSWHLTTKDNPTIDPEEIQAAKETLSSFHFNQEFMASFTNSGSGMFKEEWLKYGSEPKEGSWYIAIDLAGFKDVANASTAAQKRLDQSAIAVVKATDDGKWFVEKIEHGRWDIDETAMRILKNVEEYKPMAVGIEKGMARQAVLGPLQSLMRRYNNYFHIEELTHGNQKKTDRIMWSLQGNFEHSRIILNSDEDWSEFVDQYLMFPSTQVHDDLIDALSYVDQLAKTINMEEFDEEEWTPMDDVVGY